MFIFGVHTCIPCLVFSKQCSQKEVCYFQPIRFEQSRSQVLETIWIKVSWLLLKVSEQCRSCISSEAGQQSINILRRFFPTSDATPVENCTSFCLVFICHLITSSFDSQNTESLGKGIHFFYLFSFSVCFIYIFVYMFRVLLIDLFLDTN